MNNKFSHRLDGLEPDNLLAFLALLGLLRALEAHDRDLDAGARLHPRAAWDIDAPPLRPKLCFSRAMDRRELLEHAATGLETLAKAHDFDGRKNLDYSPTECRGILEREATAASGRARERVDLVASLMSDAVIEDDGKSIDPTPLCLLSGGGRQYFLQRFAAVPRDADPPCRGRGKEAIAVATTEVLKEALFEPWHRDDPLTSSFRWDPEEDIRYALRAGDPTDPTYKPGTQYGANRLAAIGLPVLTLVPEARARRVPPTIIGGASSANRFSFAWPIWREPATLTAIRALLAHPKLHEPGALAYLGIVEVMVAKRIWVQRLRNFTRARSPAAATRRPSPSATSRS